MTFLFVSSQVRSLALLAYLRLGFLQTLPHGNALGVCAYLPSASNLCYVSQRYMEHLQGTLTPLVHAHVGRTQSR